MRRSFVMSIAFLLAGSAFAATTSPESPTSFEILRTSRDRNAWKVHILFRYETVNWEDVIVVTRERGRYVIDDVIYGGAGEFNPPGRLSTRLASRE